MVKLADLSYMPDGNLASLSLFYAKRAGEPLAVARRDEFSAYSNGVNWDDITLLKDSLNRICSCFRLDCKKNATKEHLNSSESEY